MAGWVRYWPLSVVITYVEPIFFNVFVHMYLFIDD